MKKSIKIVVSAAAGIVMALSLILLFVSVLGRASGRVPSLFGYTFHYVVTASMEPEIKTGDMVVAKKADISEVEQGDYAVFISPDPSLNGIVIIHKVIEIDDTGAARKLTTSGIKEGLSPDPYPVTAIIGIYRAKSSFLGKAVKLFSRTRSALYIIIIAAAAAVAIAQGVGIARQLKTKKDKKDED